MIFWREMRVLLDTTYYYEEVSIDRSQPLSAAGLSTQPPKELIEELSRFVRATITTPHMLYRPWPISMTMTR